MRTRSGFQHICMMAVILGTISGAQADPLKNPKRVINGQTVDLAPLFGWWDHPEGGRPLAAWVHVTGPVVGSGGWGWTIEALIETTPARATAGQTNKPPPEVRARILLRNPPANERAQFERLNAQLTALNEERSRWAQQAFDAGQHAATLEDQQDPSRPWRLYSRMLSDEIANAKDAQNDAKAQIKDIDQRLEQIAAKLAAFPDQTHYLVDCIALQTGQTYNRLPVYDHGQPLR
jgi:hypothetical protein